MPASTYLGNMVLEAALRGGAFTVPARVYVSLHTADPGPTGLNEVTTAAWPSYTRKDPAQGAAVATGFDPVATKTTKNSKQMNYGANDGTVDVTVTHAAVWDALTAGNMLVYGPLVSTKVFAPSDEATIKIGKLTETVV
jgi:hypothetical protein